MKKVTLILAALVLVLGISQCKKQEPVQIGEKQHIVLTANNGNDGSKVAVESVATKLNLTWESTDKINVSGAVEGTLDLTGEPGSATAKFEGTVTRKTGDQVVFTVGSQPNYMEQDGTLPGLKDLIHLKGTSPYKEDGEYDVDMELQFAVLKLDVSALGTMGELTIATGDTQIASVENVSSSAGKEVFVAVPANGSKTEYTFKIGDKTATKNWQLKQNTFYTLDEGSGTGSGGAIVVGTELLPGKFSVSATDYVQFSRGNLKATRSSSSSTDWQLSFFVNQYDYSTKTSYSANDTEMTLFSFGFKSASESFNPIGHVVSGTEDWGAEYCRQNNLPEDTWCTLTGGEDGEWYYLLEKRPNHENYRKLKKVHGILNCLVIVPDDFDINTWPQGNELSDDEWAEMERKGAVCLPPAGYRGSSSHNIGTYGAYWSSTSMDEIYSYGLYFPYGSTHTILSNNEGYGAKTYGYSIRLVQKFPKPIEYVEIGGLKWATCNLGANTPKDYGWYFSWAGTTGYVRDGSKWVTAQGGSELSGGFSWANAPYNTAGVQTSWNKYIPTDRPTYWTGGGSPDNKLVLDPEDDAANINWGDGWRMPTQDDFQTLYEACGGTGASVSNPPALPSANPGKGIYWVKADQNYISDYTGVAGILFCDGISKLFFVAAGYGVDGNFNDERSSGRYWSGTVYSNPPSCAYYMAFTSDKVFPGNANSRNQGFPIRPVHD